MYTQTPTLINGVNVDQLVATVNAIKQMPVEQELRRAQQTHL